MSLNIQDLGISEDIKDVFSEVSQGKIYFVTSVTPESNPFSTNQTAYPNLIGESDFISFQDESSLRRYSFSQSSEGIFSCKTALPDFSLKKGVYAFLSFSGGIRQVTGVVKNFQIGISSIVKIEIDSKENVPFSFYSWINLKPITFSARTNQFSV